jgi:hypothetical protein
LAERLALRTEQHISGAELISAIQGELHIPTSVSELPPTGILGLRVNLITIVHHDEEDPLELILRALEDIGVESTCFPGGHDRESQRIRERDNDVKGAALHRFQLRVPNPPSNQLSALILISKMQLEIAMEAIISPKRLLALIAVSID